MLNLINEQKDIYKIYLYAKDLSKSKYEYLIKNWENAGIKHLNYSKTFIECSNTMDDVCEDINNYNLNRIRKILIVFDDMIADIMTNKKFQAILKELFMPKDKYLSCIHHSVLFLCPKRRKIKFYALFYYEDQ